MNEMEKYNMEKEVEVTKQLKQYKNIEIIRQEIGKEISLKKIAKNGLVIIATGPLTSDALSKEIKEITGEKGLHFYDAAAPIIEKNSINMNIAFSEAEQQAYKQEKAKRKK